MDNAFEYIIKNGGLDTEADYPYTAKDGSCDKSKEAIHAASITGYKDVSAGSEADLMSAVSMTPVAIAIEADQRGFQSYTGGVFSGACGKQLDHGVLAVGYSGSAYWIVKNSWGGSWGESGYIRLAMGMDQCGLADAASYATA